MAERIRVGDRLPFFLYDTPYSAGNRFRDLLDAQAPLVLVFMANFGHPITRTFASRYADTYTSLHDGGFALVVRSRADKLARSIGPDTLPYPLLCDAAGVLYEHLSIPTSKSTLMSYSLEGWRILREAKKQGYQPVKGAEQQLPLTLILDRDGTVLTSGGAGSCRKGISQLAALLRLRDELDGPEVLIGAGVNAAVIDELRAALPGARAFHASCKTLLESGMTFRREGVPMGLPGLDEWHIQQTDADAVCAAKAAVMR